MTIDQIYWTVFAVLLLVLIWGLYRSAREDAQRTHCRCCLAPLKEPGGHGLALVGRGFCIGCVRDIIWGGEQVLTTARLSTYPSPF
jgi:hypothetical protein